jgi:16S rRNA (guanine966-N2)-methyltransferase
LFSALESSCGPLTGLRFLDLYAGTGAVGIEALSRGVAHVCFVESDDVAVGMIRANLETLGLSHARVCHQRVERFAATPPDVAAYDICFADPPYAVDRARLIKNLAALADHVLAPDAVVVVERSTKDAGWTWPPGLTEVHSRKYGDTTLWYGRRS